MNIVEAGLNLGDCGLWTASLMRATNNTATVTFVEPVPDAPAVIRESMKDNGFSGDVYARGFGNSSNDSFKLAYFPGRDGQATNLGIYTDCESSNECQILEIPNISLGFQPDA